MTDDQPDLFSSLGTQAAVLDDLATLSPLERFERFHGANPHVYEVLVRSAREYRRQTGRVQCGMSLLFGRARWVLAVQTDEGDPGLNNNYASFYSRLIMAQESDLAGMFSTRRSLADEVAA